MEYFLADFPRDHRWYVVCKNRDGYYRVLDVFPGYKSAVKKLELYKHLQERLDIKIKEACDGSGNKEKGD